MKKIGIIGAGLSGSIMARLLKDDGNDVVVYENNKIGGMCSDEYDKDNKTWVSNFGAHIWHFDKDTNKHLDFLNKHGDFKEYEHKVLCVGQGTCIYWPINKSSKAFYESYNDNSIIDEFILSYSRKMWGDDFDKIYDNIKSRFEPKDTLDNSFFVDEKQYLLHTGYSTLFSNLLKDIPVIKQTMSERSNFSDLDLIILTAPIDEFYDYKFGELDYTGIRFEKDVIETKTYVTPTPVVNLNGHNECIRIINYTQLNATKDNADYNTNVIVKEYPDRAKKFYPILDDKNMKMFNEYKEHADKNTKIKLLGRSATYKYIDMDQCVDSVFKMYEEIKGCDDGEEKV